MYRLSFVKRKSFSACENGYQLDIEALFFKAVILIIQMKLWFLSWQRSSATLIKAITSLWGTPKESYQNYMMQVLIVGLLRHEAAGPCFYQKLHPELLSLGNRIQCLWNQKKSAML